MLASLPACMLAPPQGILNPTARFVAGLPARAHVTDTMRSLHWLQVAYRIRYLLCLVMYAVYKGTSPSYIADTTARISTLHGRGRLLSSEFDIPCARKNVGERAFSVADHENEMLYQSRSEISLKYLHSSVP